MSESIIATQSSKCDRDFLFINGETIYFNDILNRDFFTNSIFTNLEKSFKNNTPFPYVIFDDLFSPKLLELVNAEFNLLKNKDWRLHYSEDEIKLGTRPNTSFGHATQLYFNTVYSGPFIKFLERITGIRPLVTDPCLSNGGLHEMPAGGKFAPHTDFNQHEDTGLHTRLAFITYLNKDWLPSYGGALELWSMEENKCKVEVEPILGRSILLLHSPRSLHGLPNAVRAPEGHPRRSALAYFYSNERIEGESASFHATLFPSRASLTRANRINRAVKYVIPPMMADAAWQLKMFWRYSVIRLKQMRSS